MMTAADKQIQAQGRTWVDVYRNRRDEELRLARRYRGVEPVETTADRVRLARRSHRRMLAQRAFAANPWSPQAMAARVATAKCTGNYTGLYPAEVADA